MPHPIPRSLQQLQRCLVQLVPRRLSRLLHLSSPPRRRRRRRLLPDETLRDIFLWQAGGAAPPSPTRHHRRRVSASSHINIDSRVYFDSDHHQESPESWK